MKPVSLEEYLELFRQHIARYEDMSPAERKEAALKGLIRSGVLNEDGTPKEQIVTR